jgi:hypothetical protein
MTTTPITTYTALSFAFVSYVMHIERTNGLSVLNHGKYYQEFEGKQVFRVVDKVCVYLVVALSAWLAFL